jgi:hypothetical protein
MPLDVTISEAGQVNLAMSADDLAELVEGAWHDSALQTGVRFLDRLRDLSRRYVISAGWTHIFSEGVREIERETRWVYDRETQKLVALDIKRSHKWREATAEERADVLDSLQNGNPGCLDNPADWDFIESSSIPAWH